MATLDESIQLGDAGHRTDHDALHAWYNQAGGSATIQSVWNVTDTAYGATGDGTTDDSAAIQAAIAACSAAGGGIVYFPPGTYIISQHAGSGTAGIEPLSNMQLVGAGRGNTFIKRAASQSDFNYMIYIGDSGAASNITIRDMTLLGNEANNVSSGEHQPNIFIGGSASCDDILIENVETNDAEGDGIQIAGSIVNNNIRIQNCWFDNNTRSGIALTGSGNVVHIKGLIIDGCVFTRTGSSDIDNEPNDGWLLEQKITNNFFYASASSPDNRSNYAVTLSGDAADGNNQNTVFANNYVERKVLCISSDSIRVTGNKFVSQTGATGPLLEVKREVLDLIVSDNIFDDSLGTLDADPGGVIYQYASSGDIPKRLIVANNLIVYNPTNNNGSGIACQGGGQVVITGNILRNINSVAKGRGIHLRNTATAGSGMKQVNISNNVFAQGGLTGMYIYTTVPDAFDHLVISGNIIDDPDGNMTIAFLLDVNDADFGEVSIIGNSIDSTIATPLDAPTITGLKLVGNSWDTSSAYTPTNVSTDRAYDADTVAVAELADIVGTLIADLQATGIIG